MNRLVNSYSENNLAVNAHFLLKTFPAQKKIEVLTFENFLFTYHKQKYSLQGHIFYFTVQCKYIKWLHIL